MTKQFVEVGIDVPEGYKATGEYVVPRKGQHFLSHGCVKVSDGYFINEYLILEKLKPRVRTFECVSETPRKVQKGEWYEHESGDMVRQDFNTSYVKHKVFKETTNETQA